MLHGPSVILNSYQTFVLRPFANTAIPALSRGAIEGSIRRQGDVLVVRYDINFPEVELDIPLPAELALRRDDLWRRTCCEFFLRDGDAKAYFEYNLSPSSDWNCFQFDDYRVGVRPADLGGRGPEIEVERREGSVILAATCPVPRVLEAVAPLTAAVAGVLQHEPGGAFSYWALVHPGDQPDFHHPRSFSLSV